MAFFEQLGKKITDTGHAVAQQTKDMSHVARLNSAVSEKEQQISQLITALGQAYYRQHRQDPQAENLETIQQINEAFAEIARYKEEINQIKGVTKCPACGADVTLDSAFCRVCGAKAVHGAQKAPSQEPDVCPNCHKPITSGNVFCNYCGTKLN